MRRVRRPSSRSKCTLLMRRKRKLKRRGSFRLWRKRSNRSSRIAIIWYVGGKGCSCNSNKTDTRRVTIGWCNDLWDIETGTEQAGKTVKRKGSYPWAKDLKKPRSSLRTGPTHFTGEWRGLDLVAGDGNGGKSHSFKLKHTALL